MKREIPQTNRWAIGNCTLEMYLANDGRFTENENEAAIFSTSFEASQKMHELLVKTDYELELLDLDPSPAHTS